MKHKNLLILSIAFVFCITAAILGLVYQKQAPARSASSPMLAPSPVNAENASLYLVVTLADTVYQPFPLITDGEYTVEQESGAKNTLIVKNGTVSMLSSTCRNQACIKQGYVSLENRELRPLGNKIICLPNKLTLALYTPSEVSKLLTLDGGSQ